MLCTVYKTNNWNQRQGPCETKKLGKYFPNRSLNKEINVPLLISGKNISRNKLCI